MATIYPNGIDNSSTLPYAVDNVTPVSADAVNIIRNAIVAVESELGINPSGTYSTVKARLDFLETSSGSGGDGYLRVLQDGYDILTTNSMDFIGATVTDVGGTATITISPGVLSHSALTNLSNDDHQQYFRLDGYRALTGDLDLDGYNIVSGGDGYFQNINASGDGYIAGKLTVLGLIDPTGLVLEDQASVPEGNPAAGKHTLWVNSFGEINITNSAGSTTIIDPLPTGVQGDILYNNGSAWVVLSPGDDGYVLKTNGASQNPAWEDNSQTLAQILAFGNTTGGNNIVLNGASDKITSSGVDLIVEADFSNDFYAKGLNTYIDGFTSTLIRNGYTLTTTSATFTETAIDLYRDVNLNGNNITCNDGYFDTITTTGDGYIAGKLTVLGLIDPTGLVLDDQVLVPGGNPAAGKHTLWINSSGEINITNSSGSTTTIDQLPSGIQGDILYNSGSAWVVLSPGDDGYILTTHGAAQNPTWEIATASGSQTLAQTLAFGNATGGNNIVLSGASDKITSSGINLTIEAGPGKDFYAKGSNTYIDGSTSAVIRNGAAMPTTAAIFTETAIDLYRDVNLNGNDITCNDGYFDTITTTGDGYISGKLTVLGLIDPTGLVLDDQILVPGGNPEAGKHTLWINSSGEINITDSAGSTATIDPAASLPSGVQGDILYHSGSAWVVLSPGDDGYILKTHGASQNPTWEELVAGGTQTLAQTLALGNTTGGNNIVLSGASDKITSSGINLTVEAGSGKDFYAKGSNAYIDGSSSSVIRNGAAVLSNSATFTSTEINLYRNVILNGNTIDGYSLPTIFGGSQGAILYRGASGWTTLDAGVSGKFLRTNGTEANPSWETAGGSSSLRILLVNDGYTDIETGQTPTLTDGYDVAVVYGLTANRTINLPSSPTTGKMYTVKDSDASCISYSITIAGNGNNIDGSSTFVMDSVYMAVNLIYTGTKWILT